MEYFIYLCQPQIRRKMKQLHLDKHVIRFRRWSRKQYAVFCSLGKCVTIGNLKKAVADVSLGNQVSVCTAFFAGCLLVSDEETGSECEEEVTPLELVLLMLRNRLPQVQTVELYPIVFILYILFAERVRSASFRHFFCLNVNYIWC